MSIAFAWSQVMFCMSSNICLGIFILKTRLLKISVHPYPSMADNALGKIVFVSLFPCVAYSFVEVRKGKFLFLVKRYVVQILSSYTRMYIDIFVIVFFFRCQLYFYGSEIGGGHCAIGYIRNPVILITL